MGYLSDYVHFNSGNHCPESFHLWSSLTLLGAVIGRKVCYNQDYFKVYPNLYVTLVGDPGSGKSIAQDQVSDIMREHFPGYFISETIQSREDMLKQMSMDECVHSWKDGDQRIHLYRPFFIISDELEALLSVNPEKMVQLLVAGHSGKYLGTGFKTTESQRGLRDTYISLHANAPPDFIMTELKISLFRRGLGRRIIIVADERKKKIAHPKIPVDGAAAYTRIITHLKAAHSEQLHGEFKMTPEADAWWTQWFESDWENKEDPILKQFHSTKGVMVLKVAMLIALETMPFRLVYEKHHLQTALAMLDQLEPKIAHLTSGVGPNELGGIAVQMLDTLRNLGGVVPEKRLLGMYYGRIPGGTRSFYEVLQMLTTTNQIVITRPDQVHNVVWLPDKYEQYKKEHPDK